MSEKRYYVSSALYLCDKDLSNTLSIFECADLLNQLTKENEQLKQKIDFYKYFQKDARELEKENEQLREELSKCERDNCVLNKDAKPPRCKAYDECLKRQGTNKPLPCIVNWMMGRPFENMLKERDDE